MNIFNEYKNKYYRIIQNAINDLYNNNEISKTELNTALNEIYLDSDFKFIDHIFKDKFFNIDEGKLGLIIDSDVPIRLNNFELEYLKMFVEDETFNCILDEEILDKLRIKLKNISSLDYNKYWQKENIDKFGDNLSDELFRKNIITLKNAILSNKYIKYTSKNKGGRIFEDIIAYPYKIEYSIKNNKFRLIVFHENRAIKVNLDSIKKVEIIDKIASNGEKESVEEYIKNKKNEKEPIVLRIDDNRGSLDRCLNLFSYYDKEYYYNKSEELILNIYYYDYDTSELILNILSLGSNVEVLSPKNIRNEIINRIKAYKFD